MFKGYTDEFKKSLNQYNQTSKNFIFNFGDLEICENKNEFDIFSPELRKELGGLIRNKLGKSEILDPTMIRFKELPRFIVRGRDKTLQYYSTWIIIEKNLLVQGLKLLGEVYTKVIIFPSTEIGSPRISSQEWEKEEVFKFLPTTYLPFSSEITKKEEKEIKFNKIETETSRLNALAEIRNLRLEKRKSIEDIEVNYLKILPTNCHCKIKEMENQINEENFYLFKNHIEKCLWRDKKEVDEFKNKVLKDIKESK